MAFEDNRDAVESVYEKMIGSMPKELSEDKYYQYFYNLLETGVSYCKFYSSGLVKNIDEEWVNALEEAMPSLQRVVLNPRKFIEEEREVVNAAMARNTTPEAIRHLMQHSNLIDKVNPDGTVVPNRILNVFKEESLNTYENRFVYTLILELQRFINKRFNVIFDNSKDERGTFFEMESLVDNYTEVIDYKLEIKIREKQTDIDNDEENMGIFTRISKLHRQINDLASGGFATTMQQYPLVRHPIVKTNAIGKNLNYMACHKLWNYIHAYDRIGYKVDMVTREPVITREFERDIYNSFLWDYFMLRHFCEEKEELRVDRPKRQKETDIKHIRQTLDEILRSLDMTDADAKKLIMNEVSNLQLKYKAERLYAEAMERKQARIKEGKPVAKLRKRKLRK